MSEKKNNKSVSGTLKLIGKALRHVLVHNGWLKLIAVVISVFLWAGLISQDETITRDKSFQNVKITVTGNETMKNNGYIVVSGLDELYADFTAAVPQKQYENAEASNYNPRIDLSRIKETGTHEIKVNVQNTNTYGKVKENSINPATVTVEVENYKPRNTIPIFAQLTGERPEGWRFEQTECDPKVLNIRGPQSIVDSIRRVRADFSAEDVEWNEGSNFLSVKYKMYDEAGEEIDPSKLDISTTLGSTDSVLVYYNILPQKTFSTKDLADIKGKPANGYTVSEVQYSPENITITDSSEVLEAYNDLIIENPTVKINGLKDTFSTQLKVQHPSDKSELSNELITVTVVIVPEEEP